MVTNCGQGAYSRKEGAREFLTPTKKRGGGAEKVSAMLKRGGGTKNVEGVLTQELKVLALLKGALKNFPTFNSGGPKRFTLS